MPCHSHRLHPPVPSPPRSPLRLPAVSALTQSPAWFEIRSLREPQPVCNVPNPGTTHLAGTAAKRWAYSHSRCSPTNSPPLGSSLVCRPDRSIAERLPPSASPAWEDPCHPRSTPPLGLA